MVNNMEVNKVAAMVADMEVHMVTDMEVDKVADKVAGMVAEGGWVQTFSTRTLPADLRAF